MRSPLQSFYRDEKPGNYYYGEERCWGAVEKCIMEMADVVSMLPDVPNRIVLVHERSILEGSGVLRDQVELLGERVSVERVIADGEMNVSLPANEFIDGELNITLLENGSVEPVVRAYYQTLVSAYEAVVSANR